MKRSYLVLGSLCAALTVANVSLLTTSAIINSASIEPAASTYDGFDYSWVDLDPYIAHAFGGILGDSYTNSHEAFLLNYQLSHRVFEVDFFITDDGKTVAAHDAEHWQSTAVAQNDAEVKPTNLASTDFTHANFMSSLWQGKYHPVDLDLLFQILQEYPDVYIVTDTKFSDEENVRKQFSAFVEAANKIDPTLLDHFIPQIYHPEMFDWIMEIYPWKSVIYTLYQSTNWTPENVITFAEKSGVKFITLWDTWLNEYLTTEDIANWKSAGILIATHTINQYARAENSRTRGADVVYTDFLHP